MSIASNIERFPPRRSVAIWLLREYDGWLVLARGHGWTHGDYRSALADAQWLSTNLELPIRVAT
jgi:hypothetical protein